ncbi:ATPase domain protein, prokaryote domain protein [Candidatus Magnetomorum sp. HK-1]|nr:ATPase domain protein, prokaryote domain protein [Candidatus Magnetomorum sp. HK-1]
MNSEAHYCLSPFNRLKLEEIMELIQQEKYFILHAPRQTGKTSCLLAIMNHINAQNKYKCLYINVESAQAAREDVLEGIKAILREMEDREEDQLNESTIGEIWFKLLEKKGCNQAFKSVLRKWCIKRQHKGQDIFVWGM